MRRKNEIKIRFFDDEFEILKAKVKRTSFSREKFCRLVLLGYRLTERPPVEYADILRELRRIGSNVYQILQKEMQTKFIDVVMLQNLYETVLDMDHKFCSAFTQNSKQKWRV